MNIFKFLRKDRKTLFLMFIATVAFIYIFVPFLRFEMIGANYKITAYPSLSATCGLVLGPIYGFFAVLLVVLTYFILHPEILYFGIYSLIPPALAVISAGVLCEGEWRYSALILGGGLFIFYLTDVGRVVFYYPCFSILAFLLVVIFRDKVSKLLFNKDWKRMIIGAVILSFTSVMIDHLYGSILGIIYLHLSAENYILAVPVFMKERLIMTAIGAFFVALSLEISKCILKNATKLREKVIKSYIEEIKIDKNILNADEELLEKYGVKIPSEKEQKEMLKTLMEAMVLNEDQKKNDKSE
jgi:hypothetical protein